MLKLLVKILPECIKRIMRKNFLSLGYADIDKLIRKYRFKNPVFLDAGACDGQDSVYFAEKYPDGIVYSFEPVKKVYEELLNTTAPYSNIKTFNLALSDKTGTSSINISSSGRINEKMDKLCASSSLLQPEKHLQVFPHIKFENTETIQTVNLDEWCKEHNVDHIDVMWLDMQGLEPVVLKASPNILSRTKFVYSEVSTIELYKNQILFDEFNEFMKKSGFRMVKKEVGITSGMGNVLWRRSNI
jgi:FkbM family methyltransferase